MPFYCYILASSRHSRTYCGYTNNLERRLKQHNGLLKGGAKSTQTGGPWHYCVYVTSGAWDAAAGKAMSFEWHVKHPAPPAVGAHRQARPVAKRLAALQAALELDKFKHEELTVYVHSEHAQKMPKLPQSVNIVLL